MTPRDATAPLRELPRMVASDCMVVDATAEFGRRAQRLSPSQLVQAGLIAVDYLQRARPEWSQIECRRTVVCVLREAEQSRSGGRRAA